MARPIRLQLAGAHYLVTARAASPDSLFKEEQDRARFVDLIGRSCQRYRWRCHAWCLGTDYYQLLIAIERPNLATGMRHLNSVHSQTLHRHRRVGGQLFEGRYDSKFVDPDTFRSRTARRVNNMFCHRSRPAITQKHSTHFRFRCTVRKTMERLSTLS